MFDVHFSTVEPRIKNTDQSNECIAHSYVQKQANCLRDLLNMINTTTAMFTSSATDPVAHRAKDDFMMTSCSDVK